MLIIQKPEGYCFEKNIPDIIIQKENDETVIDVSIKLGTTVILNETYKFDVDGIINIRNIDEIISSYLISIKTIESGNVITIGLLKLFSIEINAKSTIELEHAGIDHDDQLIIDEDSFSGNLSEILSVGDKLYKIGDQTTNLLITAIDDQTYTIDLNGDVSAYINEIPLVYFELNRSETINFSVIKCEADMPNALNAGTFAADNFLTRLPREKRTATNRNEYLSFIHFDNYGSVIVKYKAYYISSTGVYTDKTGNFLTIAAGTGDRYITFNASLAAVRTAAALPTEEILQYDLWFTESALSIQSNAFTFLPDPNHYRDKKYFVFENSFGVLETFTAAGTTENKISNEYNLANIQSRYRKTTQDFVSEKTCNTGFLSTDEMEWLNDLLLSYNVGFYLPGVSGISEELTLTGHDKTDTDENVLQAFKFNYRRAKNNHLQFVAAALGIFDNTYDQTYN